MIYQPEINKQVSYIYCSASEKASVLVSALQLGSCYSEKFNSAVILKMYSRAARSYKTFCELPTAAWKCVLGKADGAESVQIRIDSGVGTYTTTISVSTKAELLNRLKGLIEENTEFMVDLFNEGFYAYTYSDDYDYNDNFIITLAKGDESITSMEDNLDEIVSFWNPVITSDDVDAFSKDTVRINNSTKNCS